MTELLIQALKTARRDARPADNTARGLDLAIKIAEPHVNDTDVVDIPVTCGESGFLTSDARPAVSEDFSCPICGSDVHVISGNEREYIFCNSKGCPADISTMACVKSPHDRERKRSVWKGNI